MKNKVVMLEVFKSAHNLDQNIALQCRKLNKKVKYFDTTVDFPTDGHIV